MSLRLRVNKGTLSPWLYGKPFWMRILFPAFLFLLTTGIYHWGENSHAIAHLFVIPMVVAAATAGWLGLALNVLATTVVTLLIFPLNQAIDIFWGIPDWIFDSIVFVVAGAIVAFLFNMAWGSLRTAEEERDQSVQKARELESLRDLDRVMMGNGELEDMLGVVLKALTSLRGAVNAAFWRLDEERGVLLPEASAGLPREFSNYFNSAGGVRLGEMAVGWAVLQRSTTAVRDIRGDPRFARFPDIAVALNYASAIGAPIVLGAKVYGALGVGFSEPRDFTEDDTTIVEMLANQMAVGLQSMEQRQQLHDLTYQTIAALGEAIDARDPYTGGHCHRLADYSIAIAQEMGLSRDVQEKIRFGSYLHDVGKVGVADTILKKPGPLTIQEYAEIKQHPYIGSQLIKRIPMLSEVAPIVYHHHERYDGSGYPDGISGERIPIEARIIGVVDAFDAMTNERPYRKGMILEEACQELENGKGTQFDPQVVEAFLRVLEKGLGVADRD